MEDNSQKKLVAVCIVGVTWLSITGTENYDTDTARVEDRSDAIDNSINHSSAAQDADANPASPHSKQDDDVDIALGGSWGSNDCTFVTVQVVKVPSGEMVEALECRRSSPKPTHAYETYSDEALESLVHSDPIAALVLGRRFAVTDPETSWDLMIRASALLGGDSRPIKWLATNSFNQVTTDGELATGTMQLRYVLDALTERLDGSSGRSFDFREYHLRESLSDAEFDRLDLMVDSLLRSMKLIEEETTGFSTIGGAG